MKTPTRLLLALLGLALLLAFVVLVHVLGTTGTGHWQVLINGQDLSEQFDLSGLDGAQRLLLAIGGLVAAAMLMLVMLLLLPLGLLALLGLLLLGLVLLGATVAAAVGLPLLVVLLVVVLVLSPLLLLAVPLVLLLRWLLR